MFPGSISSTASFFSGCLTLVGEATTHGFRPRGPLFVGWKITGGFFTQGAGVIEWKPFFIVRFVGLFVSHICQAVCLCWICLNLGGGNSKNCLFSPRKLGEMIEFDEHMFQGLKPPTRDPVDRTGVINLPILGGSKQYKCMGILRDFP